MRRAAALTGVDHPVRLAILQRLEEQEAGASELARQLGIGAAGVRHHLGRLRDGGLVVPGEREGTWRTRHRGWGEIAERLARLTAEDG